MKDCTSKHRMPLRQLRLCRRRQGILSLPDELLLELLKGIACQDILKMRQVHPRFKELIDSNPILWTSASFVAEWPSTNNFKLFERAASKGNIEALIKLGVSYLYYEGVTDGSRKDTEYNGQKAAEFFCKAEECSNLTSSFTWLFIRPPWSSNGACCKACVLKSMRDSCSNYKGCDPSVLMCIAKTYGLSEEEGMEEHAKTWLQKACEAGCNDAAFSLWKKSQHMQANFSDLHTIRQLREFASSRCLEAKIELYSSYCKGYYGGLASQQAAHALREFFQSSLPSNHHNLYKVQKGLNTEMRYILVDWLVEVTGMKDYSSLTLHTTICCIDRYLMLRAITRADLQLVGIAGIVMCARLLEKDIITIREAAWLTDGTYKYEDVVRMLGDIVATLHGNLRVLTVVDYLELLCSLVSAEKKTKDMAFYISEMSLLHSDFGSRSPAKIASCALYLARLMFNAEYPWSLDMSEFTGFTIRNLEECTLMLHRKCFSETPLTDHREVTLVAVKQRYAARQFSGVSSIQFMSYTVLCDLLGVEEKLSTVERCSNLPVIESFLTSPVSKSRPVDSEQQEERRQRVVTPTLVLENDAEEHYHNESFCSMNSGYDGDAESEGDHNELVCEEFGWLIENIQFRSEATHVNPSPSKPPRNSKESSSKVQLPVSFQIYNSPPKHIHCKDKKDCKASDALESSDCSSHLGQSKGNTNGQCFTIGGGGKLGLRRSRSALRSVQNRVYHLRNSSHHLNQARSSQVPINTRSAYRTGL